MDSRQEILDTNWEIGKKSIEFSFLDLGLNMGFLAPVNEFIYGIHII